MLMFFVGFLMGAIFGFLVVAILIGADISTYYN